VISGAVFILFILPFWFLAGVEFLTAERGGTVEVAGGDDDK
jgi:hypothetical protein